jgi:hypothetical protein
VYRVIRKIYIVNIAPRLQVLPVIEDAYMETSKFIDKKHGYMPNRSKLRAIL